MKELLISIILVLGLNINLPKAGKSMAYKGIVRLVLNK